MHGGPLCGLPILGNMRSLSIATLLVALIAVSIDARVKVNVDHDPKFAFANVKTWDWNPAGPGEIRMGRTQNDDPEAMFQMGWILCEVGAYELGLTQLQRAISKGYYVWPTLTTHRAFDAVRQDPLFLTIVSEAETGRNQSFAAFREAGGQRLLGV